MMSLGSLGISKGWSPSASRGARRHNSRLGIKDISRFEKELGNKHSPWKRNGAYGSLEGVYSGTKMWRIAHNPVEIKSIMRTCSAWVFFQYLGKNLGKAGKPRWTLKINNSESLGSIDQNLDCSSQGFRYKIQKVIIRWYWVSILSQPESFCIVYLLEGGSSTLTWPGRALPVDWMGGPG